MRPLSQLFVIFLISLSSCVIVRQDEVGVKSKLGKLNQTYVEPGPVFINPFTSRIIKVPTRTVNVEIRSNLPSKEGLNVQAEISILYHINPQDAPQLLENIGPNYEDVIVISVFRSVSADVCSRFFAKDMHSSQRAQIEREIVTQMDEMLNKRGFEIEAVLLKNIQLPQGLARSVEEKLEAEQDAQRMEFILQRENLEAQRKLVEAKGIRDAQKVIAEGLNDNILKWQGIEAFKELSKSPNAKIIITDSDSPMMVNIEE
ncbi:MAG: prohibitin 1 [Cyclobacteriaceae bacterium]|jgi:prohibitin 1